MKTDVIPYNPMLRERARALRGRMTLAEVLLWKQLNRKQMLGYDFDRQRPIDAYVVDFFCRELRLAIEVDGRSHNDNAEADRVRQERLESLGIRFLRVWDSDVKHDMRGVLAVIRAWIEAHAEDPHRNPPRPTGTPPGEGI